MCLIILTFGLGLSEPTEESQSPSAMEVALATRDWWSDHIEWLESFEERNPIIDVFHRESVVAARRRAGDYAMFNPNLPPAEKYPYAYQHYQELIALKGEDADSREKLEMIESIYRSLGRPIPQL